MANLTNLTFEELKMLAKTRKVDGYENMSRQKLESIFIIPSPHIPAPRTAPRAKNSTSSSDLRPAPKSCPGPKKHAPTYDLIPKNFHLQLSQNMKNVYL